LWAGMRPSTIEQIRQGDTVGLLRLAMADEVDAAAVGDNDLAGDEA
jgi:hypothetical protein